MSDEKRPDSGRRAFLKLGATAAPAALAAAATGTAAEAAPVEQTGREAVMQDTPHTRAFFDTARF